MKEIVIKEEVEIGDIILEAGDKIKISEGGDIAKEIQRQLGRKAFVMMGAKNLAYGTDSKGDESLSFKIGNNSKGVTHITITLNRKDLYDVKFIKIRGSQYKVTNEEKDIYNDMLKDIIESNTGLYLSL